MATDATFDVLFVGTGVSVGVPSLEHLMLSPHACSLCEEAYANPSSRNRRNNVSIMLIVPTDAEQHRCVLVDCGKTFRDAALSLFRKNGISEIHSVLYTHEHADAMEGSDDLRDFQRKEQIGLAYHVYSGPLTLYMTSFAANTFQGKFPYVTRRPPFIDASKGILERNVAWITMEEIEDTAEFVTQTLPVKCFPVLHGGSYVSLGFNFGRPGELVYISDVKIIPPESMEYLKSLPQIRVLVIDCLNPAGREHYAHFNLTEALECIAVLNPVKAYLVGMCCKCGDHDAMNEAIRAMGLDNVELAYDGMRLNGLHKA